MGSTSGLLNRVKTSAAPAFIVATEAGILHKMNQEAPEKQLIPAPPDDESCSCNYCPFMRLNTLEKLYLCLRDLRPQVEVPEQIRLRARVPIERMLELGV